MAQAFLDAIQKRRTYYNIAPELPEGVTEERIEEIISVIFTHVPSPFNCQSSRAIVLLNKEHIKLWEIVFDTLKNFVPPSAIQETKKKIERFKRGYGTILFFEDCHPVKEMQSVYPSFSEKFPWWSEHTNAMHQLAIWTALECEGLGASLQHYNPIIDEKVKEEWKVPATWALMAQMPFGKIAGPPSTKTFEPLEKKVKYYGKM